MIVYADFRWPEKTGIGVYFREILQRVPRHIEVVDLKPRGPLGSPLSPLSISRALEKKSRAKPGVFWSPGYMPPATFSVPATVTVHDLLHLHFHSRLKIVYYELFLRRLYSRCRNIICVSENARDEFLKWSGLSADRVLAIHNGVSDVFRAGAAEAVMNFRYVFFPGNHQIHKNKARLLEAFAASVLPRNDVHLIFTGLPEANLQSTAEKLGVSGLLHFVGHVSDDRLVALYKGALLVAYVSLYEGFGLPILEAMAAGVPVLTSTTTAMPEVAGDAALLVNPHSVDEICKGLNLLAFDERERALRTRLGIDRAKRFTWDAAAARTWAVVEATQQRAPVNGTGTCQAPARRSRTVCAKKPFT